MCDLRRQRLEACIFPGRFLLVYVNRILIRDSNRFRPSGLQRLGHHVRIVMAWARSYVRRIGKCCIKAKSILLRVLEDARNARAKKSSKRRVGKIFSLSVACRTGSASFWRAPETKR